MPIKKPLIKVCDLRRPEDAKIVNEFPVSYVGFVFAKSKRKVDPGTVAEIKKLLRPDIKTAGVFADMNLSDVRYITDLTGIDIVQLHSEENNWYCGNFKDKTVWKSFAVKDKASLDSAENYSVDGYLLDAYDREARGGTGKAFKWDLAADFAENHFTILAGGITPENVAEAAATVKPDVIDLSSSLETEGFKDYNKVKALFDALKLI
ncbi:MAG: phosphoribosylanthranilate isomerase [Clostridiales bacterium]|nr:phosphoribosylanthranilate isomerase [Clostridiales bacterium]